MRGISPIPASGSDRERETGAPRLRPGEDRGEPGEPCPSLRGRLPEDGGGMHGAERAGALGEGGARVAGAGRGRAGRGHDQPERPALLSLGSHGSPEDPPGRARAGGPGLGGGPVRGGRVPARPPGRAAERRVRAGSAGRDGLVHGSPGSALGEDPTPRHVTPGAPTWPSWASCSQARPAPWALPGATPRHPPASCCTTPRMAPACASTCRRWARRCPSCPWTPRGSRAPGSCPIPLGEQGRRRTARVCFW